MKLSLMEFSEVNTREQKFSIDLEKRPDGVHNKKSVVNKQNLMKLEEAIRKDATGCEKLEINLSSSGNFLPIDGVDSDAFSAAKGKVSS